MHECVNVLKSLFLEVIVAKVYFLVYYSSRIYITCSSQSCRPLPAYQVLYCYLSDLRKSVSENLIQIIKGF